MRRNENDEEREQNTESDTENHHHLRRWFDAEVIERRHNYDDGKGNNVERHRRKQCSRIPDEHQRIHTLPDDLLPEKAKPGSERHCRQANFSRPNKCAPGNLK